MTPFAHIIKAIEAEAAERARKNGRGTAPEWGDYKERGGFVQGLERAVEIIREKLKGNPIDED